MNLDITTTRTIGTAKSASIQGSRVAANGRRRAQDERHGVRALALELVALERAHREHEVVARQLVVVAVDRHADRAPGAQHRRHVAGIERLDRLYPQA